MSALRLQLAVVAARLVAFAVRIFGHSGTSLPGKTLLAIDSQAIRLLAQRLQLGTVIISATNGKTTTASLTASALDKAGIRSVHNREGANMAGGIAAALADRRAGEDTSALGLFEVDEFWLDGLAPQLMPKAVLLGNLFRDQLDRYGEMDTISARWRSAALTLTDSGCQLLLCADDPMIAAIGADLPNVRWFGIEDRSVALEHLPHAADSISCRGCGSELVYETVLLGHLGHWQCPNCGIRRPAVDYAVTNITIDGAQGSTFTISSGGVSQVVELPLPGLYNIYNALGAWALCDAIGLDSEQISEGFAGAKAASGRAESFDLDGCKTTLMLIKNPTGANEVLRTLSTESEALNLVIVLNDRIADGRDISWVWDADFETLAGKTSSVWVGGTRASEMALRLRYAGFGADCIHVEPGVEPLLERALSDGPSRLWVLPTYTALAEVIGAIESRAQVESPR
ncbi:MAG: Mur ligase family protein [Solirubrobacterales bacterium]|nr:Mur ligase family protein [Solirubrobacterales bacterium]